MGSAHNKGYMKTVHLEFSRALWVKSYAHFPDEKISQASSVLSKAILMISGVKVQPWTWKQF